MTKTLENTQLESLQEFVLSEITLATDADVIAYLRYSHKIAEYAVLAERNAFVLNICQQFDLTVTDEELQTITFSELRNASLLNSVKVESKS